ncbi:MAG: hypothetical protein K2J86_08905 [Prevotella sp.]|nr:hypothetical protein [Prevotella sp.]
MRRFVLSLLFLMSLSSFGQRTDAPYVASQNNKIKVKYVDITDKATIVSIVFNGKGDGFWTPVHTVSISSNATLVTSDGYNEYTFPIRELSDGTKQLAFDQYYSVPGRKNTYCLKLIFDKIPAGCTSLDLNENVSGGWIWRGVKITNPACSTPHKYLSESEIKNMIIDSNDGICGIYEGVDEQGYKLACVKEDDEYLLLFMGVKNNDGRWYKGDVKAELRSSASAGLFKAT